MKLRLAIVTVVVVALAASGQMLAQAGNAEKEIRAVMDQLRDAALKGDADTFAKLTADDYTSIGADGRVLSKAEVVDGFRAGNIKFDSIETSGIKVQVYGDTAVVTDTSTIKGHRGDHDLSGQYRDSRVFVKRGGKWQSVLLQRTKISP
jgi:uncharacterized protein (TIGR02246 family)